MKYRVEIDYYDEYFDENKTLSYVTECDSEDQAYDSWSYGEDIPYDTVNDVRVEKIEETA